MLEYPTLKTIHVACVALSISGFALRGTLMLANSGLIWNRTVRTIPHLVDTVLLASGIWLASLIHLYPGTSAWLTAKLLALLLYIGLGFVALRRGRTKRIRVTALVGALLCFAYMALVALGKNPMPLP